MNRALAIAAFSTALVCGGVTTEGAEVSAKEVLADYDSGNAGSRILLLGMDIALGWANAELKNAGARPHFCAPPKIALQPEQYVDIFKRFVEQNPSYRDKPAGFVFLIALEEALPCPR